MAEQRAESLGEVTVCRVGESNWRLQRRLRLAMLQQAPRAFATTYAEAAQHTDEEWLERIRRVSSWLAMEGAEPLGSVGLWHARRGDPSAAWLVGMWVEPSARGRGVGEILIQTVVAEARRMGLRRVVLDVAHENAAAIALYERAGFTPTGATGALPWDRTVTEFEMELLLDG